MCSQSRIDRDLTQIMTLGDKLHHLSLQSLCVHAYVSMTVHISVSVYIVTQGGVTFKKLYR